MTGNDRVHFCSGEEQGLLSPSAISFAAARLSLGERVESYYYEEVIPTSGNVGQKWRTPSSLTLIQNYAAIRRIRSSCSCLLSAPMVKASRTPDDRAYLMASS